MRLDLSGQLQLPIQVDRTVTSLLVTIEGPVDTALLRDPFGKHFVPQKLCGTSTSIHLPNARTRRQLTTNAMRSLRHKSAQRHDKKKSLRLYEKQEAKFVTVYI